MPQHKPIPVEPQLKTAEQALAQELPPQAIANLAEIFRTRHPEYRLSGFETDILKKISEELPNLPAIAYRQIRDYLFPVRVQITGQAAEKYTASVAPTVAQFNADNPFTRMPVYRDAVNPRIPHHTEKAPQKLVKVKSKFGSGTVNPNPSVYSLHDIQVGTTQDHLKRMLAEEQFIRPVNWIPPGNYVWRDVFVCAVIRPVRRKGELTSDVSIYDCTLYWDNLTSERKLIFIPNSNLTLNDAFLVILQTEETVFSDRYPLGKFDLKTVLHMAQGKTLK